MSYVSRLAPAFGEAPAHAPAFWVVPVFWAAPAFGVLNHNLKAPLFTACPWRMARVRVRGTIMLPRPVIPDPEQCTVRQRTCFNFAYLLALLVLYQ